MKRDYKTKFKRLSLMNRWKLKSYSRNGDWVILGIHQWYASPTDYCYKICVFGFDLQIWFERHFY